MASDKIRVLLEELRNKEQEVAEVRTQVLDVLAPHIKNYFLKQVESTTDFDTRRDYAVLSNAQTFTFNEDGTLTFTALSYGTKVSHIVKLEELLG